MQIDDGRKSFYQWDINQRITSSEFNVGDEIHFHNMQQSKALPMIAYELDGKVVVDVPNILLRASCPMRVYKYLIKGTSGKTVYEHTFKVIQRPKPDDYVYTETEVYTVTTAVNKALEDAKNSGEFDGKDGEDGYTPIKGVDYFDGKDGVDGTDGSDGYTPQKGIDYYTDAEKTELIAEIERTVTGDVETALDELHAYAQSLVNGGAV